MINQLLNEPYFNPKLEKKPWTKDSDRESEALFAAALNLDIDFKLRKSFYNQDEKINTDEKFIDYLKSLSWADLEILETIIFEYISWNNVNNPIRKMDSMSLRQKCEFLGISWYLSDRNVQNLVNYYNEFKND